MAQDETYETKVYQEQGGNRYVAGNGGVFAVESGGSVVVYSGGQFTVESGMNLALAGGNIAGDDLRRVLVSEMGGTVVIEPAAGSAFLPIKNLPKNVRHVIIYGSTAAANASFWLTSVSAGREVTIYLKGNSTGTFTNASTQVVVSCSGCILLGSIGAAISGFKMHTSLASDCFVNLVATLDNTWAIVGQKGNIVE